MEKLKSHNILLSNISLRSISYWLIFCVNEVSFHLPEQYLLKYGPQSTQLKITWTVHSKHRFEGSTPRIIISETGDKNQHFLNKFPRWS